MLAIPEPPAWIDRIRQQLGPTSRREYQVLNRLEDLRAYLETHLGATRKECERDLGWNAWTIRRYMRMIRKEWKSR